MWHNIRSLLIWILYLICSMHGQSTDYPSINVVNDVNMTLSWWESGVIYQVYPRSFKDSNGDGVGDLTGILSQLDYFTYLGIDCIWLSPVYKSPMRDFGYDISDYKDIDLLFGTIQDFRNLVHGLHSRGLKLITDFVPGHVSTDHEWFKRSVRRDGKYNNYFIWDDGRLMDNGTRLPPNNWVSAFGGSAWQWNSDRQQFYYHAFDPTQADLNYRDENLRWDVDDTLRYWLDMGVDGFRVDAFAPLYETDNRSLDEPLSGKQVPSTDYDYLDHIYTTNQPESILTLSTWYNIMTEYKHRDGRERFMVVEVFSTVDVRNRVYATGAVPFNFDLLHMSDRPSGHEIVSTVMREYTHLPRGKWPNFVLGNHDSRRVSHKYGVHYVNVFNMLLLTLWGTPTTYYGEELGMMEADISWKDTVDPQGLGAGPGRYQNYTRDPERSPMQWTPGSMAGFTEGNSTWLPIGKFHDLFNVQTEKESLQHTTLQVYKQLVGLRKKTAFQYGKFQVYFVNEEIVSYIRADSTEQYLIVLNFGHATVVDLTRGTDLKASVEIVTPGVEAIQVGQCISLKSLELKEGHGLVLKIDLTSSLIVG